MATRRQIQAAKRNITSAQATAKRKRTIANLPQPTRRALRHQAAKGCRRHGQAGRDLPDRNREQIYDVARRMGIPGRSKMGKWS